MSWPGENRRQHPRFPVQLQARIFFQGEELPGETRDISAGGICLVCSTAIIRGAWIRLLLSLKLNQNAYSEGLEIAGKVVWCTPLNDSKYQIGVSFDTLEETKANYMDIFLRVLKGDIILELPETKTSRGDEE